MSKINEILTTVIILITIVLLFVGFSVLRTPIVTNVPSQKVSALPGSEVYNEVAFLGGMRYVEKIESIAKTSSTSLVTLQLKDSGTNYVLSASGTTITLPAVSQKGVTYRFTVGGALDTDNYVIDSAEGDNMEGTLIVAGAVVDCDAEDQLNFVVDGENIGDYVEVVSDGTQWLIVDSGVLTSGKLTCTDPS